ncbi:MAG: hypothetical protein ACKPKO_12740, partial [Candidatus Fonsibacter sp.]
MLVQATTNKTPQRKEEVLDHEITDGLRARVTERQHNNANIDRKRITVAQREKHLRVAMMDQQVSWSEFKGKK